MNNIKFEDALSRLEAEVRRLEGGSMTLEDSIASFEEAVKLVKICNEKLDVAERRIRILTEGQDGVVTDTAFLDADET